MGLFPTKDMQTSPLPSVLIWFLWIMRTVLNRMKKILRFLFFELRIGDFFSFSSAQVKLSSFDVKYLI